MKHMMLDLETLGTEPGCIILSIGAVDFDPLSGKVGENGYYAVIDMDEQLDKGLTSDPGTLAWWKKQNPEARAVFDEEGIPIKDAVKGFRKYWDDCGARYVWAHGSVFDVPIWCALDLKPRWKFWDIRDTRTIFDLTGGKPERGDGTFHNALDDSIAQAKGIVTAYRAIGLAPKQEAS